MINFPHKVVISSKKAEPAAEWCSVSLSKPNGVWKYNRYGAWADETIEFEFALAKHAMLFELVWKH